ncbi:hypothetical protein Tcan_15307 [Toxocara canis]|uniref:Uncharacterized protein n=1 Tax=Toxocara canis TaxID=6265 RepID=A0A0B2VYU7_TOXCA|nr:hypothetical protein Tcan_15307 [Toxocara canis]
MLQFTFATERDFVFRRFTLLKVQVGILAVFCIFVQMMVFLSQLQYMFSSVTSSNTQKNFIVLLIAFATLFIVASPFAAYGILTLRYPFVAVFLLYSVLLSFTAILLFIVAFTSQTERLRRIGIEWLAVAPVYIFSTVVAIWTFRLAQAWMDYNTFGQSEKQIEENYLRIWNQQGQMIYIRSLR